MFIAKKYSTFNEFIFFSEYSVRSYVKGYLQHSKNCGVKITPPEFIEDHTMHFTPVLNCGVSSTPSGVILTPLVVILTLFGVMFKL